MRPNPKRGKARLDGRARRPMPFQSIEPRRLYRQIADQIRGLIGSGEFPAGSRLPPERDLARQLGVSRPSVREALIALEVEGLVEVRIGSGIYVMAPNVQAVGKLAGEIHAEAGPFELLRARYVIESECAALAAKSARKTQLASIAEALDQMQRELDDQKQPFERRSIVPPAHSGGDRQRRAGRRRQDALGRAHRTPLPAARASLRFAGVMDFCDGGAPHRAEGDRQSGCGRGARRDAAAPEPGVQAVLDGLG